MLVDVESLPSPDDIIDGRDDSFPAAPEPEEKKRRKPFWFEGTYLIDEEGKEVKRIADSRWEEEGSFGGGKDGGKKQKKTKEAAAGGGKVGQSKGKSGKKGDSADEEEGLDEADKSSWLSETTSPEALGNGREGWE